ncbi:MAG: magnesium transporter [Planctomycetes bacterium]|nr:magnesium transporter [Planctomycetota bacterium]
MSPTEDQQDPSQSPAEPQVESAPTSHVEDVAETSPHDERVAALLEHSIDVPVLAEAVEQQEAADAADTLETLHEEEAAEVLEQMDDQSAAEALAEMQAPLAVRVIEEEIDEDIAYAAKLIELMAPDDAADLLQEIGDSYREEVLAAMPLATATKLRELIGYDPETAGGLMTTDFPILNDDLSVANAVDRLRAQDLPKVVQHLLVVGADNRVVGAVGLRDLVLGQPDQSLSEIMNPTVKAVRPEVDREEVAREFDRYDYSMLPVIDLDDRLIGIVTVDDVIDIIRAEQTEDVQKTVGAGAQEAVYSGVMEKFRGRFPWLMVSLVMMVPTAWIILMFEDLIREAPILAMLMPVIAAIVGNGGHQALAVTQRGLVLEEVRRERILPLLVREWTVGLMTGFVLGAIILLGVGLLSLRSTSASWWLGAVTGVGTMVAMSVGTLFGSVIPMLMKRLGFDPAQSSAIFLIMITDAVSFGIILSLSFSTYEHILAPGS